MKEKGQITLKKTTKITGNFLKEIMEARRQWDIFKVMEVNIWQSIIETLQNKVATATATESNLEEAITTGDLNNYVTKVTGKELSTNDFTDAYKTILDGLTTTINNAVLEGKKSLYPVGSLYFNISNNTNPATLLGFGKWELTATGKTLIGVDADDTDFDTVGETGGSKTHTMTISEMPSHAHGQKITATFDDGTISGRVDHDSDSATMKEFPQNVDTYSTGGGQPFSILPPYITTYIWKRIL